MEERYQDREFEQFIKENADQYRMFPSEKVWDGIHNSLHAKRRWYGIGLALLLLTTGVVTWLMLPIAASHQKATANTPSAALPVVTQNSVVPQAPAIILPAKNRDQPSSHHQDADTKTQPTVFFTVSRNVPGLEENQDNAVTANNPVTATRNSFINEPVSGITKNRESSAFPSSTARQTSTVQKPGIANTPIALFKTNSSSIANDFDTPEQTTTDKKAIAENKKNPFRQEDIYPLTIESVVNAYHSRKKKLSWQFYMAPTISYRTLKENMNYVRAARSNGTIPTNVLISFDDLNSVVTHKPDVGFELGFNTAYPVNQFFSFIAGLQFNVSKYDILAFNNHQSEVATIALNNSGSNNSVSAITSYRSYGSNNSTNWLHNLYISASIPIGAEVRFNSTKKSYFGASSTLQPTYILANRAYLISTDFKNYAEVPSLTRKWNLNTSFEIFAGYSTPKLDWKIGPQIRYQTLSSFQDLYPVREHLVDFGLKLGVTLK